MNRIVLLLAAGVISASLHAAPRTMAQMKCLAAQQLHGQNTRASVMPNPNQFFQLDARNHLVVFANDEGATVVVTNDDRLPAVIGVSESKDLAQNNQEFKWFLDVADAAMQQVLTTGRPMHRVTPDPSKYPTEVPNLLTTTWSQDEPYKNHTPLMPNGDNYVTGCVATSMAQVLAYHRLPLRGKGRAQLTAPDGSVMEANFAETLYDWDNMKPSYSHIEQDYTTEEGEAVAVLMAHCGVATNMSYAEGGSGTQNSEAVNGLRTYFGYDDAYMVQRQSYSNDEAWMNLIFDELAHRSPIMYGGVSTYGHSFVFAGYREDGLVYVNWGWGGDKNGWYDVNVLDPDNNGGFVNSQSMVIGIRSYQPDVWEQTVTTSEGGQLESLLSPSSTYGKIKVVGPINSDDIRHLRERVNSQKRTGYPYAADTYSLDLSEAQVVVGGSPFLIEGSRQYSVTANDELPAMAFNGCTNLRYLTLPTSLKAIGSGAFGGCMALTALEGQGEDYVCEDNLVFNGDKTRLIAALADVQGKLVIPEGVTAIGDYAFSSLYAVHTIDLPSTLSNIGKSVFATTDQQLSAIYMRSEKAPKVDDRSVFNVIGPQTDLYVHAAYERNYQTSSAYKQFRNLLLFGTLLTATGSIREYGDENPAFGYSVKGDPITGEPGFETEADMHSPAGTYVVKPTQGTITSENVIYQEGKLIVQKAPLTAQADDCERYQGKPNPEFTITYIGLKNDDTPDILTVQPTASTTATTISAPGIYPITLSGGESDRYDLSYQDGTLTVIAGGVVTGIQKNSSAISHQSSAIYDLQGRRVANNTVVLKSGIYIQNHRKIAVGKSNSSIQARDE